MAEIRKHNPSVRDEIDAAILAALGEDVRHVAPGEKVPEKLSKPAPATPTVTATFATTLGGGAGWKSVDPAALARPVMPKAAVDDDDEDDAEL